MFALLYIKGMPVCVDQFQPLFYIDQPYAIVVFLQNRIFSCVVMKAVVHFKVYPFIIMGKGDENPRGVSQADAMFKGIFYEWIEQHGSNHKVVAWLLDIDPDFNFVTFIDPHFLDLNVVFEIFYFFGQRYPVLVVFIEHKPHHIAQFLDAIRRLCGIFFQRDGIKRIEGIKQKVGIDLGPEVAQFGRGIENGGF